MGACYPQTPKVDINSKCGVYIRNTQEFSSQFQDNIVPLRHLDYHLQVVNSLLNITLTQIYVNPTDKFMEVDYSHPIQPESSIYSFYVEFNNIRIDGIVKKKEEAREEFEKKKKQGNLVAIGGVDPDSKDVMNLEIGNIPPKTQFTVTISLLQEIKISMNTFYQIHIPSTISPRYVNKVANGFIKIPEFLKPKGQKSFNPDFTWSFKVDLSTGRRVTFFNSPSHQITLVKNVNDKFLQFEMSESEKPNKDFFFLYSTEDFHLPTYVLGGTDSSSTVMLSFIPKFCQLNLNDAYEASIKNKSFETDINAARGEYIFLIDRSGSMSGSRIEKAKESLILFLKSLPEDSYFNVVSFGSSSCKMFPSSGKNTSKNISFAVKQVETMNADLGGTEIYSPLYDILCQKVIDEYPRQVFLLTDGGVSNTQGVINLIKTKTKYSRVHSIGIGNGVSLDLIEGSAKAGKGHSILISDKENPNAKIISLLESSLTPVITKINIKCSNENQIESIVPNPNSIPYILKNEVANFYITFKGPLKEKQFYHFQYKDSLTNVPYISILQIDPNLSLNQPFVNKMAHLKVLRSLQNSVNHKEKLDEQILFSKVQDPLSQTINYSLKHQILSQYTAFLCVGKELIDGQYQQFKQKGICSIHVEQTQPIQYRSISHLPNTTKYATYTTTGYTTGYIPGYPTKELQISQMSYHRLSQMKSVPLSTTQNFHDNVIRATISRSSSMITNSQKPKSLLEEVISLQAADGSWSNENLIGKLAKNPGFVEKLAKNISMDIVVTKLVIIWLTKNHQKVEYNLIIKKAVSWLNKKIQERKIPESSLNQVESL